MSALLGEISFCWPVHGLTEEKRQRILRQRSPENDKAGNKRKKSLLPIAGHVLTRTVTLQLLQYGIKF